MIQRMLECMFLGDPPGVHDRILHFSTAVTGGVFFAPPASLLERLEEANILTADASASSLPQKTGT